MKRLDSKGMLPFLIVLGMTLAAGDAVAQPESLGEGYNYSGPEDKTHARRHSTPAPSPATPSTPPAPSAALAATRSAR